jgi:DNA-binding NarL/FixJ family response regulator
MASNQGPCSQQPVSVIVADDHPVILLGIAGTLQAQLDINVVAACSAGRAATAAIREFIPDVGRTDGSVGTRVRC